MPNSAPHNVFKGTFLAIGLIGHAIVCRACFTLISFRAPQVRNLLCNSGLERELAAVRKRFVSFKRM